MKKENVDQMYDILDKVFNNINNKNRQLGSGLQFGYNMNVNLPDKKLKKPATYTCDISLREAGHGERILQTFTYERPDNIDVHSMKYQVMQSVITIMFESTMLQWNEIGKLLNTDDSLQGAAIEIIK